MTADPKIRAALEAAEDALLRYLWVHDGGHDPLELTPDRIATIRGYGDDSGWNVKTRGTAAAVAAFLHAPGVSHALASAFDCTFARAIVGADLLAAAVEEAARHDAG